jgi:regulator of sigma E protease
MRDKNGFASVRYPMIVDSFNSDNSPAAMAGLLPGDTILSINDTPTPTIYDVREELAKRRNEEITVGFNRNGVEGSLSFRTDTAGNMGIYIVNNPQRIYSTVTKTYSFPASFPAGASLGVNTLKGYVGDMKYVFTKEGASSLGGFGAIGNLFPSMWDWRVFWMTTALLSIILAFMNILPIPALDGGHVMFLLYEIITRRKPSDKFLEYAQITGMIILFALLIYANGNDLFRFFSE